MASQAVNSEINHAVIWGTTINVNDAMSAFADFERISHKARYRRRYCRHHDYDSISGDETLDGHTIFKFC